MAWTILQKMRKPAVLLSTVFIFLTACDNGPGHHAYSKTQIDSLARQAEKYRRDKDRYLKSAPDSPLKPGDRPQFKGLDYFPYDIGWRFAGPVYTYADPESITIIGSGRADDIRPAQKYGYFKFVKNQKTYRLEIIKILPVRAGTSGHLFLGFWDETSGQECYAGGRYIDLVALDSGQYLVDFNYAYNPYCAYNSKYSCAIPPLENRLNTAIRAGEKKYGRHHETKE